MRLAFLIVCSIPMGSMRVDPHDGEGTELDRVTGPTGTGDDGAGPAVADSDVVSTILAASAPPEPGTTGWATPPARQ